MKPGRRIELRGTVQGVGFRPWVYRLARANGIGGRVRNHCSGVTIEAFALEEALDTFVERLRDSAPEAAHILELRSSSIPFESVDDFVIEPSEDLGQRAFSIPPDLALCPDCESELLDPKDRRYRYPFINCTSCGPRYTIATDIPYDRAATTMADFVMCPSCQAEYDQVLDRRFHAQPNACPSCGPTVELLTLEETGPSRTGDPIADAASRLTEGLIVAVKGLGGFHLACDATDSAAVTRLRERKHRDEKPFAVMVRDLRAARELARLSGEEESLLSSAARPIVLVRRQPEAGIADVVAPNSELIGLFLAYSPLHLLLLDELKKPLVMTSANLASEPICASNDEAEARLKGIADALLVHDRDIASRCDDSVARVIAGAPMVLRRSRGYVPRPIKLARAVEQPILSCGAQLKNSFCLVDGDLAYFGPHIGELDSLQTLRFFEEAVEHMQKILGIRPELLAYDLHPAYLSSQYALAQSGPSHIGVQHHHAHIVSVMAEHALEGPVIGLAYDGTGHGLDGTSWGGELLLAEHGHFTRLATFRSLSLPGGNAAMREVWRTALSLVDDAFDGQAPLDSLPLFRGLDQSDVRVVQQMLERGLNAPRARGVGRYFDAMAAIALNRPRASYEGQLAVAWNRVADPREVGAYPFDLDRAVEPIEIDLRPLVRAAVQDLLTGLPPGRVSARFHRTLVDASASLVRLIAEQVGKLPVVLSGGVFQNAWLAEGLLAALSDSFELFLPREVPPGDGGLALGQAIVANQCAKEGQRCA